MNQLSRLRINRTSSLLLCMAISVIAGCCEKAAEPVAAPAIKNVPIDEKTYPVVILGGGIAGLTASIYAAMANYTPLVVEGPLNGGLLTQSHSVQNWPGELDIPGMDLADKIHQQATAAGAIFDQSKVVSVDFSTYPYQITLESSIDNTRSTIKALTIINTMGTTSLYLNVSGEKEYWGHGVSNCAVCDGYFSKDKDVVIIGGGNTAITEAAYLSKLARKVYILVRRDQWRATDRRKDEVLAKDNVEARMSSVVESINGDGQHVTSVTVRDLKTNNVYELPVSAVFSAIGSVPNSDLFKGQLKLDTRGYIVVDQMQQTSKPGIFAAGDIADPFFKQAVSAAGDGAKAALQANEYLEHMGYNPIQHDIKRMMQRSQKLIHPVKADAEEKPAPTPEPTPAPAPAPEAPRGVITISSQQQMEQYRSNGFPTVIDFYAPWCGPCRSMGPVFERLANEYAGRVQFLKINIDQVKVVANQWGVRSIPAFMFLNKRGERVDSLVGSKNYQQFKNIIDGKLLS